ncbi:MAG: hypothetical protein V1921_05335 [Candidatus Altiarchaeota archaeon]
MSQKERLKRPDSTKIDWNDPKAVERYMKGYGGVGRSIGDFIKTNRAEIGAGIFSLGMLAAMAVHSHFTLKKEVGDLTPPVMEIPAKLEHAQRPEASVGEIWRIVDKVTEHNPKLREKLRSEYSDARADFDIIEPDNSSPNFRSGRCFTLYRKDGNGIRFFADREKGRPMMLSVVKAPELDVTSIVRQPKGGFDFRKAVGGQWSPELENAWTAAQVNGYDDRLLGSLLSGIRESMTPIEKKMKGITGEEFRIAQVKLSFNPQESAGLYFMSETGKPALYVSLLTQVQPQFMAQYPKEIFAHEMAHVVSTYGLIQKMEGKFGKHPYLAGYDDVTINDVPTDLQRMFAYPSPGRFDARQAVDSVWAVLDEVVADKIGFELSGDKKKFREYIGRISEHEYARYSSRAADIKLTPADIIDIARRGVVAGAHGHSELAGKFDSLILEKNFRPWGIQQAEGFENIREGYEQLKTILQRRYDTVSLSKDKPKPASDRQSWKAAQKEYELSSKARFTSYERRRTA